MKTQFVYKFIDSPVGKLKLIASERGLAAVLWENEDPKRVRIVADVQDDDNLHLLRAEGQLHEYFAGVREIFDLTLDMIGSDFQKEVWHVLLAIPYGETRSYGEIAKILNRPTASRAVGGANRRNPLSIIAACHRVISATGALTGFAGGLDNKSYLLTLEKTRANFAHEQGNQQHRGGDQDRGPSPVA